MTLFDRLDIKDMTMMIMIVVRTCLVECMRDTIDRYRLGI